MTDARVILLVGAATVALLGAAVADNTHGEETIGMIVMEAMGPTDDDAALTGRAFLDTLERMRKGGVVTMPDMKCPTNECVGVYMAIEMVRKVRTLAAIEARNKRR